MSPFRKLGMAVSENYIAPVLGKVKCLVARADLEKALLDDKVKGKATWCNSIERYMDHQFLVPNKINSVPDSAICALSGSTSGLESGKTGGRVKNTYSIIDPDDDGIYGGALGAKLESVGGLGTIDIKPYIPSLLTKLVCKCPAVRPIRHPDVTFVSY
jgi:hypothetical protein